MKDRFVVLVTTAPALHQATRELATRLAARTNAVLLFLHVVPLRRGDGEAMLHSAVELATTEPEAWLRRQRPSNGGVRFRHHCAVGQPEAEIAAFVADHQVDLVVAEEPPRSWLSAALWRGLAERLVRRLDCPVVVGGPGFLRGEPPSRPVVRSALGPSTVAELLNAMVDARVEALRTWMDHAADSARRIADSPAVRTVVAQASRPRWPTRAADTRHLEVQLDEHLGALRAVGWRLALAEQSWGNRGLLPLPSPALTAFLERVQSAGQSTSLPLAMDDGLDRLVLLAGARVGEEGLLLLAFDAEDDFLRILGQPGPLPSFETYAFDEQGLMLSNSRFPDHLCQAGLLPADDLQTPLRLRVAEPSDGPVDRWPLTHMARQAVQEKDGWDTRGYRDYRGTPVVGAWRWLSDYGFGVTAEIDREVAFR